MIFYLSNENVDKNLCTKDAKNDLKLRKCREKVVSHEKEHEKCNASPP